MLEFVSQSANTGEKLLYSQKSELHPNEISIKNNYRNYARLVPLKFSAELTH